MKWLWTKTFASHFIFCKTETASECLVFTQEHIKLDFCMNETGLHTKTWVNQSQWSQRLFYLGIVTLLLLHSRQVKVLLQQLEHSPPQTGRRSTASKSVIKYSSQWTFFPELCCLTGYNVTTTSCDTCSGRCVEFPPSEVRVLTGTTWCSVMCLLSHVP